MASIYQTRIYRLSGQNGTIDESYSPGVSLSAFGWVTDPVVGAVKRLLKVPSNTWQTADKWHACISFRSGCQVYSVNKPGLALALQAIQRMRDTEDPARRLLTDEQIVELLGIVENYVSTSSELIQATLSNFLIRVSELQTMLDGGLAMMSSADVAEFYSSYGDARIAELLEEAAFVIHTYAVQIRSAGTTVSIGPLGLATVTPNSYTTTSVAYSGGDRATAVAAVKTVLLGLMITNADTGIKTIDVPALAGWMEADFRTLVDPAITITYPESFLEKANQLPPFLTLTELGYTRPLVTTTPITAASVAQKKAEVEALGLQIDRHYSTFAVNGGSTVLEKLVSDYLDTIDLKAVMPEVVARVVDSRFYVTTWVTTWGEESAPSPVSDLVSADQNDVVVITRPDTAPAGYGIEGWRLYRSNAGTSTAEFQLVPDLASISSAVPQGDTVTEQIEYIYKELNRNGLTGVTQSEITDWEDQQAAGGWLPAALRTNIITAVSSGANLPTSGVAAQATATALLGGGINTEAGSFDSFTTAKTVYNDAVKGSALGEVVATVTWTTPPANLKGLCAMANGVMAGYYYNTLCVCEPYAPYAWPVEYQIPVSYPIVGIEAVGQSLFVGTRGTSYLVSGADSASMSSIILAGGQACVAARSIVALDRGVVFASPEGLCLASGDGVTVITAGVFMRNEWEALDPASIIATQHDGVYYFKSSVAQYALDLSSGKLVDFTITGTAFFHDKVTDKLFTVSGTTISEVFGGTTNRTCTYKTGIIKLPKHQAFAWLQVDSDFLDEDDTAESVTVKWYGDGALIYTATVTSITPVRLPSGRYLEHEVELISKARITSVSLAGSTAELQNG